MKRERSSKRDTTTDKVWRGIANYANAGIHEAPRELARLLGLIDWWTEVDVKMFRELGSESENTYSEFDDAFRKKAVEYQSSFRQVLAWISSPEKHPELTATSVRFLDVHAHGVKWELKETEAKFERRTGRHSPAFFRGTSYGYDTVMAPICNFIVERVDLYNEGELELIEAVPILVCQRLACGKFFVPLRAERKRFCSDKCRISQHELSTEEARDYAWLHRLDKTKPQSLRRERLQKPKVRARLRTIEAQFRPTKGWQRSLARRARSLLTFY